MGVVKMKIEFMKSKLIENDLDCFILYTPVNIL